MNIVGIKLLISRDLSLSQPRLHGSVFPQRVDASAATPSKPPTPLTIKERPMRWDLPARAVAFE